jgi:hypothetical protein
LGAWLHPLIGFDPKIKKSPSAVTNSLEAFITPPFFLKEETG